MVQETRPYPTEQAILSEFVYVNFPLLGIAIYKHKSGCTQDGIWKETTCRALQTWRQGDWNNTAL